MTDPSAAVTHTSSTMSETATSSMPWRSLKTGSEVTTTA